MTATVRTLCMSVLWGLALAQPAHAHQINIITYSPVVLPVCQLVSVYPADNALLNGAPARVSLTFSEHVNPDSSGFTVYDPYNTPLELSDFSAQDSLMSGKLPTGLTTGQYRLEWHVTCLSANATPLQGTVHFTIQ